MFSYRIDEKYNNRSLLYIQYGWFDSIPPQKKQFETKTNQKPVDSTKQKFAFDQSLL